MLVPGSGQALSMHLQADLLGQIAVNQGYVDDSSLVSCLELQNQYASIGNRIQIGQILDGSDFVFPAMLFLFLLLGLRLLLRRDWLAFLALIGLMAVLKFVSAPADESLAMKLLEVVFDSFLWVSVVLVLVRYGLLALVFFWFFVNLLNIPASCGLSGWQSEASWTAILFITAITVYGFHTALAGRPLFRDELLQE